MAVTYRNAWTGRIVTRDEPDRDMEIARKWERVEDEPESELEPEESESEPELESEGGEPEEQLQESDFDPGQHSVGEVNTYLADADLSERERVLQAESEGKGRVRILTGPYSDLTGA